MSDKVQQIERLEDVKPQRQNINRHTQRGIGALEKSIQADGWIGAITVAADGETFDGSARIEVGSAAGFDDAIVVHSSGDRPVIHIRDDIPTAEHERAKRLGAASNRVAQLDYDPDPALLAALAGEVDLSGLYYDDELAALLADVTAPDIGGAGDDFDTTPQDGPTRTALGDLWVVGDRHRLIIGDSTDPAVVERLMGGEKAKLTMTSPPYWVGKDYEQEQTWAEVQAFIARCAFVLSRHNTHRIVINTGAPQAARLTGKPAHIRLLIDDWQRELEQYGFLLRYVRIWSKRGGLVHTRPLSDCVDQHWEFIGVFYNPDTYEGQRRLGQPWALDGLWEMSGEMSSGGHTAAFPIEIPQRNIELYTDRNDLIYEPFMGSGSTLVAAHQVGRRCYGCELLPRYADLAIARAEAAGLACARVEP